VASDVDFEPNGPRFNPKIDQKVDKNFNVLPGNQKKPIKMAKKYEITNL
jgi:hypothetical protein